MPNDGYHDEEGNRTKLDTRHLEWCSEHPLVKKEQEKEKREREARKAYLLLRGALCVFCGYFALTHIGAAFRNLGALLEGAGVLACLLFIAATVADAMDMDNDK